MIEMWRNKACWVDCLSLYRPPWEIYLKQRRAPKYIIQIKNLSKRVIITKQKDIEGEPRVLEENLRW